MDTFIILFFTGVGIIAGSALSPDFFQFLLERRKLQHKERMEQMRLDANREAVIFGQNHSPWSVTTTKEEPK